MTVVLPDGTNQTVDVINGGANVTWTVPKDFEAGNFTVDITYNGNGNYTGSNNKSNVEITFPYIYLMLINDGFYKVNVGDVVTAMYKLGNNGTATAYDVYAYFYIPKGLEFITASVDYGKWSWDSKTRILTWHLDEVPVGDPFINITVRATAPGTYIIVPSLSCDEHYYVNGNVTIVVAEEDVVPDEPSDVVESSALHPTGNPIFAILLCLLTLIAVRKVE